MIILTSNQGISNLDIIFINNMKNFTLKWQLGCFNDNCMAFRSLDWCWEEQRLIHGNIYKKNLRNVEICLTVNYMFMRYYYLHRYW